MVKNPHEITSSTYEISLDPQRTISLNVTNLKKYHKLSNEHAHISKFEIDNILASLDDMERIRRVNQNPPFIELKWKNSDINRRFSPGDYSRIPMEYRRILERRLEEDDRVHLRGVTLNSTIGHEELHCISTSKSLSLIMSDWSSSTILSSHQNIPGPSIIIDGNVPETIHNQRQAVGSLDPIANTGLTSQVA